MDYQPFLQAVLTVVYSWYQKIKIWTTSRIYILGSKIKCHHFNVRITDHVIGWCVLEHNLGSYGWCVSYYLQPYLVYLYFNNPLIWKFLRKFFYLDWFINYCHLILKEWLFVQNFKISIEWSLVLPHLCWRYYGRLLYYS